MDTPAKSTRRKKQAPQRAVPMSVRRSGKPLFFGWGAHLTHHEREQVKERLALGIGIVLALLVAGILINGWYQDNVVKPANQRAAADAPAAVVGGHIITKGWFRKVVKYRTTFLGNQLQQLQSAKQQLASSKSPSAKAQLASINSQITQVQQQQSTVQNDVLQQLIDGTVVQQKGASVGFHPNTKGEQAYLHNIIYNQAGGPNHYASSIKQYGMTVPEFNSLLIQQYDMQQMQKFMAAHVQRVQYEAHVRHILVADQKTALKVERLLLQHKGTWAQLAKKYSQDPASKLKGGDLGWFPHGQMVAVFDHAAFTYPVGDINIVHSQFGWHVIQVLGRKKQKLSASAIQSAKSSALQHWLSTTEAKPGYVKKDIVTSQVPLPNNTPPGLSGATGSQQSVPAASGPGSSSPALPNGQTAPGAPAPAPGAPAPAPAAPSLPGVHVTTGKSGHSSTGSASHSTGSRTSKSTKP